MKTAPRVKILIDELVLYGFSPADRETIGESLSRELERLISAGNTDALTGLGNAPVLRTPKISLSSGTKAETVGARVAQAVHGSLNSHR